jgi:hypothetical protein
MINVRLEFVPPGGGETDYSLEAMLPAVPRPGDYIMVSQPNETGASAFIVRRIWWMLHNPTNGIAASVNRITAECEFARGPLMSKSHEESCNIYSSRGLIVADLDESAY